jgi:hypothetical protein
MTVKEYVNIIYEEYTTNIHEVYQVFIDFYGEDKVDLQGLPTFDNLLSVTLTTLESIRDEQIHEDDELNEELYTVLKDMLLTQYTGSIIIHFPRVSVTNEHNNHVDIKDLFARVKVRPDRTMTENLKFIRTTFDSTQWNSRYSHSHVGSEMFSGSGLNWARCCLGTGPLIGTIAALKNSDTCSLDTWQLFCLELSLYVTVESLQGVPYQKLEEIGLNSRSASVRRFNRTRPIYFIPTLLTDDNSELLKDFLSYVIKSNRLKFSYINNRYQLGMPFTEYMLTISNLYIEWVNVAFNNSVDTIERAKESLVPVLGDYVIKGDAIYTPNNASEILINTDVIGTVALNFKGRDIRVVVTENTTSDVISVKLIPVSFAQRILDAILFITNLKYGQREEQNTENNSGSYWI